MIIYFAFHNFRYLCILLSATMWPSPLPLLILLWQSLQAVPIHDSSCGLWSKFVSKLANTSLLSVYSYAHI